MPKSRQRKKPKKKKSAGRMQPRGNRPQAMQSVSQYPIRECLINTDWADSRIASIILARNRPDGRIAFAAFVVDLGCLSVKSVTANPAISLAEYERGVRDRGDITRTPCDPAFALKMMEGAVDYAKQLGFDPDPDYYFARAFFGDIDPQSCPERIEYGMDRKPFYCAGPYDDVDKIMAHLNRTLGPDKFHFLIPVGPPDIFEGE